ncbi:hypothetical protein S40288_10758 [Stachybotrys chartarum IBT 40288]|nr:hypothetical protein S40288_10758 [Stachybotrys chartarum IBT 40288]
MTHTHAPARSDAHDPPRSLYHVCLALSEKLDAFLAEAPEDTLLQSVQARLKKSMDIVQESFKRYRPEEIAISWNGGKDCLVMLVVILASLARSFKPTDSTSTPGMPDSPPGFPERLRSVYIVSAHPFPEVDDFVVSSSAEYYLDTTKITLSMKEGLGVFLKDNSQVKAIFVGTRRTDPFSENLKEFDPTDSGWPPVMRLHSVLDWRLAEIWAFIRHLEIPYCSLYDQGYTSLGGKLNTVPNPRLKTEDGESFLPAYELLEDDAERLGRYG